MENSPHEIQTTHFRYLKEEAIRDPFLFIKEFCLTETDVEFFRDDIRKIIHAAGTRKSDNNGKFYRDADEYVYNQKKIIEVIETLWVLHHQPLPVFSLENTHHLYQTTRWKRRSIDVKARLNNVAKYYRKLENEEINDIRLFLKDFFLYSDLNEWREILDDLLSYTHIDESIAHGSPFFSRELIPITEYLEKMAEAFFLIAELIHPKKEAMETLPNTSNEDGNKEKHPVGIQNTLATSFNKTPPKPALEDDNFTDSLIQYLNTYWMHLDEQENISLHSPIMFTETLEQELLVYFETYHPTFLSRNFRRVYIGYLEHLFDTGTPYYYEELREFTTQMDTFFELLDLADDETKHWPQENRIG